MFTVPNQDCGTMKLHFDEAYENILISGRGMNVLDATASTQELSNNEEDSIITITDVMSTMQMSSNANTQSVNVGVNVMR